MTAVNDNWKVRVTVKKKEFTLYNYIIGEMTVKKKDVGTYSVSFKSINSSSWTTFNDEEGDGPGFDRAMAFYTDCRRNPGFVFDKLPEGGDTFVYYV